MSASLLYDGIFCIVLFLFFITYYGKGLLKALLQLLGFLGAFAVALFVSGRVAPLLYARLVQQRLVSNVAKQLTQYRDGVLEAFGDGWVGRVVRNFVTSPSQLSDADIGEKASEIVAGSLESVATSLLRIIVFVVAFLLAYLLIKFIARLFGGVNAIPVIGFANRLFGGMLGLVMGLLVLLVISACLSIALHFYTAPWLNADVIAQSSLFSLVFKINPFYV